MLNTSDYLNYITFRKVLTTSRQHETYRFGRRFAVCCWEPHHMSRTRTTPGMRTC